MVEAAEAVLVVGIKDIMGVVVPASLADRLMVNPVVNRTIGLFGGDVISVEEDGR